MKKSTLKVIFVLLITAAIYAGCTSDEESTYGYTETGYFVPNDIETLYCLGCHVSYEKLTEKTNQWGDGWGNPHNSFHGGGAIACTSCHSDEWMPLASEEGECKDIRHIARLSKVCESCHERYSTQDMHSGWDYSTP